MNNISPSPPFTAEPLDYERDFAQWLAWQTEFLRAKDFEQLDLAHLIEEFAALAANLKHELKSRIDAAAVRRAAAETGLAPYTFPKHCPYPVDALLDIDFIP